MAEFREKGKEKAVQDRWFLLAISFSNYMSVRMDK